MKFSPPISYASHVRKILEQQNIIPPPAIARLASGSTRHGEWSSTAQYCCLYSSCTSPTLILEYKFGVQVSSGPEDWRL
ncbi:hypothetical protein QL285_045265 [Trifolium repens]|nr:hypothetical protein QL285_045265 [Trifolium repens]